jgi:hypothetical protein
MSTNEPLLAGLAEDLHTIADTIDHVEQAGRRMARTLRDELGDLAAVGRDVAVHCSDGHSHRGTIAGVGLDHLIVEGEGARRTWVALFHVVAIDAA